VRILLQREWRSLSDIAERLENDYDLKMTLPGLLKHMRQLEGAGMIRHESGIFAKKPDARKTVYMLQGKERVEKLLQELEGNIRSLLDAGVIFNETAKAARRIQGMESHIVNKEMEHFESLLRLCETEKVNSFLTEDEKKKTRLWRMMIKLLREK
jgi:DNA-binding Lrp family transcriptional regulator